MDSKTYTPQKKTIDVLDGVRAIACLSVIEYHIHYLLGREYKWQLTFGQFIYDIVMSGWAGVDLFFVLSGFLLFMPYAKSLLFERPWPSVRTFYMRRALRILPGYYLTLFLLILFTSPEFLRPDHWKSLLLFLTFLMDAPSTYQKINGPFWTLAVEWQYYMLLPLFAWGFSKLVRLGKSPLQRLWLIILCLVGMILWGLGTRYLGEYQTVYANVLPAPMFQAVLLLVYGGTGKYFEVFAVGMLVCTLFVFASDNANRSALLLCLRRSSAFLFVIGFTLLLFMCVWGYFPYFLFLLPFIGSHVWMNELGFALGYGLCILGLLFSAPLLRWPFELTPLRWLGKISFSLYMWHLPILLVFMNNELPYFVQHLSVGFAIYWTGFIIVIIPFSYIFYRFVEYPGIQFAHRGRENERKVIIAQMDTVKIESR